MLVGKQGKRGGGGVGLLLLFVGGVLRFVLICFRGVCCCLSGVFLFPFLFCFVCFWFLSVCVCGGGGGGGEQRRQASYSRLHKISQ